MKTRNQGGILPALFVALLFLANPARAQLTLVLNDVQVVRLQPQSNRAILRTFTSSFAKGVFSYSLTIESSVGVESGSGTFTVIAPAPSSDVGFLTFTAPFVFKQTHDASVFVTAGQTGNPQCFGSDLTFNCRISTLNADARNLPQRNAYLDVQLQPFIRDAGEFADLRLAFLITNQTPTTNSITTLLAFPAPTDPILAADNLPAFCASGAYTYTGTNKARIQLELDNPTGPFIGQSASRDLAPGTNLLWGGFCLDPKSFIVLKPKPTPDSFLIAAADPTVSASKVLGTVRLQAVLYDSVTGAKLASSSPSTYQVIKGISATTRLLLTTGGAGPFSDFRDTPVTDLSFSNDSKSDRILSRSITGLRVFSDSDYATLNMEVTLDFLGDKAELGGRIFVTDALGNDVPAVTSFGKVDVAKGHSVLKVRAEATLPAAAVKVSLQPFVTLPSGQEYILQPIQLLGDSVKVASIDPDPRTCTIANPAGCIGLTQPTKYHVQGIVFSRKGGKLVRRTNAVTRDGVSLQVTVVVMASLPSGATIPFSDDFSLGNSAKMGVFLISYEAQSAASNPNDPCPSCARDQVGFEGMVSPDLTLTAGGIIDSYAFANGQLGKISSKITANIRQVLVPLNASQYKKSFAKDFNKLFFSADVLPDTQDFIAIRNTWAFSPAVPRDGTLSATLTLTYSAADLPVDPNFDESKLQIISLDAAGVLRSYPTTLDRSSKSATTTVDSLDLYYSLAVLGPFSKTSLLMASPAANYVVVNTGSNDAILNATAYDTGGIGSPDQSILRIGQQKQFTAPAWIQASTDNTASSAAGVINTGLQLAVAPSSRADTVFVHTDVEQGAQISTELDFANPAAFSGSLHLSLFQSNGAIQGTADLTIGPKASLSAFVDRLFPSLPATFSGYLTVSSSQPVAASGYLRMATAITALAAQPLNSLSTVATRYVPQLGGKGVAPVLHLVNTAPSAANVTLRAWSTSGAAASANVQVKLAAGQQYSNPVTDIFNIDPATEGSVQIDSDTTAVYGDVLVVDSTYQPAFVYSLAAIPQISLPQNSWVLPYAAANTTVNVFNPGSSAASVTVTPYGATGTAGSSQTVSIAARGRASVAASGGAYATITSTLPVIASGVLVSSSGVTGGYNAIPVQVNLSGGSIGPTPQISSGGVVNAASFVSKLVRGGLASLFGTNLANSTANALSLPLPTMLGGASLTVGGIPAPLIYVSPGQINFQVPFEVPAGSSANVVITNSGTSSPTINVAMADYGVGVFTYPRGSGLDPIVVHGSTNQLVTPTSPATPNEALVVYATGVGKLTNSPNSGVGAPGGPLATAVDTPAITVGGSPATVLFSGLTPGFIGLVQFNIQLPASLPSGSLPLVIQFPGDSSASVGLAVQGNVIAAAKLGLSTTSLPFLSVTVGQTKDLSLLVSNKGGAALNVTLAAVSGAGFSLTTPSSFVVPPNASSTVTVRYAPASAVSASGTLTLLSNDANSPTVVGLSGTGIAPAGPVIEISSNSLDFGTVGAGLTRDINVTVRNHGNATLTVSVSPGAFSNARFSSPQPGFPFNVGENSFQFMVVRFSPTSTSSQIGLLTLTTNDPAQPSVLISLIGNSSGGAPQDVTLKVDGGTFDLVFGFANGQKGAAFVNRLTPASYPATLKSVQIHFGNRTNGLAAGTPITLIYGSNPSGIANFNATLTTAATQVLQVGSFSTYSISNPVTITSGDFIVGFLVDNPVGIYPADLDIATPSQQRSYYAAAGSGFTLLDTLQGSAGNLGIRAVATIGP